LARDLGRLGVLGFDAAEARGITLGIADDARAVAFGTWIMRATWPCASGRTLLA